MSFKPRAGCRQRQRKATGRHRPCSEISCSGATESRAKPGGGCSGSCSRTMAAIRPKPGSKTATTVPLRRRPRVSASQPTSTWNLGSEISASESRHDDVIAETAVAIEQPGDGAIDLFERKALMLEHGEVEQSGSRQYRHLLALR